MEVQILNISIYEVSYPVLRNFSEILWQEGASSLPYNLWCVRVAVELQLGTKPTGIHFEARFLYNNPRAMVFALRNHLCRWGTVTARNPHYEMVTVTA